MYNLNYAQREYLLHRIISGFIVFDSYIIRSPTASSLARSYVLGQKLKEDNKYSDWLTMDDIERILITEGHIDRNHKQQLKDSNKLLDDLKVALFEGKYDENNIRAKIQGVRETIDEYTRKINYLRSFTLEGFLAQARLEYLVCENICRLEDQSSLKIIDPFLLDRIFDFLNDNYITAAYYRELARGDPWRSYWNSDGIGLFPGVITEWSEEQRNLIMFSRMYDNAYKSVDCPTDDVIDDDDKFDGWMIYTRRKYDEEKKTSELDKRFEKYRGYNEVFVVAKNEDEIKKINAWNASGARQVKNTRIKQAQAVGTVKEHQLVDQASKIRTLKAQKFNDAIKSKFGR